MSRGGLLAALVLIGVVVRLAVQVALAERVDGRSMDSQNYLRLAHNLAVHGRFWLMEGTPSAFVAPGYPLVLAILERLFGDPLWPARWLQAVVGGLSVIPLFLLAERIHSRAVAVLAALVWAVHPELAAVSHFLYPESLFLALFVVFLWLCHGRRGDRGVATGRWPRAVACGAVLAVATLIRPVTLLLPLALVAWSVLSRDRRTALPWSLLFLVSFAVVILPWSYRNYREFGRVIPVAGGGGASLWEGMYLPFDGRFRYEETSAAMAKIVRGLPPEQWDPPLTAAALESMRDHPLESAWLAIRKVGRYLVEVYGDVPRGTHRQRVGWVFWPLALAQWTLLLLAVIGLVVDRRAGWRSGVLYLVSVYFVGLHAFMLSVPRYRLPVLPLLVILASIGCITLYRRLRGTEAPSEAGSPTATTGGRLPAGVLQEATR